MASVPCGSCPCDTGISSTTFSSNTRYYDFLCGPNVSSSYPLFVVLNGALVAPYNTPKEDPFVSTSAQGQSYKAFATANAAAVLFVWSTCETESTPFALCSSGSGQWTWHLPGFAASFGYDPNDLGWIASMISTATGTWGADASRILVTGTSTGGIMAHLYGATETVLAIGAFAGPLCVVTGDLPCTAPTVSSSTAIIWMEQGDRDTTLPYCGGPTSEPWIGLSSTSTPSEDTTFTSWTSAYSCSGTGSALCTATAGSPTGVLSRTGTGCASGARIMFTDYPGIFHSNIGPTYEELAAFWNFVFPSNPAVQSAPSSAAMF